MPRGRRPDLKRRQLMAELRAKGLSFPQIGKRFGISRQSVEQALRGSGNARLVPIHCRKCKTIITQMRTVAPSAGPVYCVNCLPSNATFGQRLKTYRLAAGMTLDRLGKASGVGWDK